MGGGHSKNLYSDVYRIDHSDEFQPQLSYLKEGTAAYGNYSGGNTWLDAAMIFMIMKSFIQHEHKYQSVADSLDYKEFSMFYNELDAKRSYGYSIVIGYLSSLSVPHIKECIRSITPSRWIAFAKEHM